MTIPTEQVITLDEDVEYPDGYNRVEVETSGDVSALNYFPDITLTANPNVLSSDGKHFSRIDLTVNSDLNAPDDYFTVKHYVERCTCSDIHTIGLDHGIDTSKAFRVYEWQGGEDENTFVYGPQLPSNILHAKESQITIDSDYMINKIDQVIVDYWGNDTASFKVGRYNGDPRWWEPDYVTDPNYPEYNEEDLVGGGLYSEPIYETTYERNEVMIEGKTISIYYLPTENLSGRAYVSVNYKGTVKEVLLTINLGWTAEADISIDPDPPTIGAGERSICTLQVTDANGNPGTGSVSFFPYGSDGKVVAADSALHTKNCTESGIITSTGSEGKNTIQVEYPIHSITRIDCPNESWSFDPDATGFKISGNTITLGYDNMLPISATIVNVEYVAGGIAHCTYQASADALKDQKKYVAGKLGSVSGSQAIATITIGAREYGGNSLELSPEPGDLEVKHPNTAPESIITIWAEYEETYTDDNGDEKTRMVAGTGDVSLQLDPATDPGTGNGHTLEPRTVRLGQPADPIEELISADASDLYHVTASHPIHSIEHLWHNGIPVTWDSFQGNEITFKRPLDISYQNMELLYTPDGWAESTYLAASKACYVTVQGKWRAPDDIDVYAECGITVGDPGALLDYNLEGTIAAEAIWDGEIVRISAIVKDGDTVVQGEWVHFYLLSAYSNVVFNTGMQTGVDGVAYADFESTEGVPGLMVFAVEWGKQPDTTYAWAWTWDKRDDVKEVKIVQVSLEVKDKDAEAGGPDDPRYSWTQYMVTAYSGTMKIGGGISFG